MYVGAVQGVAATVTVCGDVVAVVVWNGAVGDERPEDLLGMADVDLSDEVAAWLAFLVRALFSQQ